MTPPPGAHKKAATEVTRSQNLQENLNLSVFTGLENSWKLEGTLNQASPIRL